MGYRNTGHRCSAQVIVWDQKGIGDRCQDTHLVANASEVWLGGGLYLCDDLELSSHTQRYRRRSTLR
jgi:hypothetical protein